MPAGISAGQLDGVFIGIRAPQREQEAINIPRGDLGQQLAQQGARFAGHARADIRQFLRLASSGVYEALGCVVDDAQAVVDPCVDSYTLFDLTMGYRLPGIQGATFSTSRWWSARAAICARCEITKT